MKFLAILLVTASSVHLNDNQQRLVEIMAQEGDAPAAPEPLHVYRGEAYTHQQYDVTHPTDYTADAPKGYRIAITGNHGLAQTYPSKDSASYITPYNQRDHAWTEPQYDVANETHWVVSSPRGSHLNVSRPLYHEIVNGTVGGGTDNIPVMPGVDQPGFDNHFNEPKTFLMTMAEALNYYGLSTEPLN